MDTAKSDDEHLSRASGSEDSGSRPPRPDLRTNELYLTCACARGDNGAILAFERAYFGDVDAACRRIGGARAPALDEVRQLVRHKLFVGIPGERPKICHYSGRGDLRSWFRVLVSRLVLNLQTRPNPEIPFEDTLLTRLLGTAAPAIEFPKEAYKAEFRTAFAEAFAGLSDRERSLLRYAFGEDLTVETIGTIYGVHKATAARWVVRAHEALLERVRALIVARLGIADEDYASILRAVRDSLELSLERYLKVLP